MGKLFKTGLTTGFEAFLALIVLCLIGVGLYQWAPGLRVGESKTMSGMDIDSKIIDNKSNAKMLPFPEKSISNEVADLPLITIAGYAWNGQKGIYAANGGALTTKGSLMEKEGINLRLVRQDWLSELSNMQMKFIDQYDSGQEYPTSDKAAAAIMIMGDGAPFYISTRQAMIDKKYGKGKYHLKVIGCMGMSNGEDKLIGPKEWKSNAKSMLGALISTVPGDGDWVTLLNFCFANRLKVNPDFETYDPNAVNIFPSEDDDYMNSAAELIKSQNGSFTVSLKEVKNGKLTGRTIDKKIDGCATWTPGDKKVFDALTGFTDVASTANFPNQMPTTIIIVDEWAKTHSKQVISILKATLTATNQIKTHDAWHKKASESIAEGFGLEDADYWYNMAKGQKGSKGGVEYNVGGTRYLNYSDVLQYYGIGGDGLNRYKSVYDQVSDYLIELNPSNFNKVVDGKVVPYEDAINLTYLKSINDIDAGQTTKMDYSGQRSNVMASGEWNIEFNTGSTVIKPGSYPELNKALNLLIQAEQTKVDIIGHTDSTGNANTNMTLSKGRAQAVANWFGSKGISQSRIQTVTGKGSTEPIGDNNTSVGRAKNRRVQIRLLN